MTKKEQKLAIEKKNKNKFVIGCLIFVLTVPIVYNIDDLLFSSIVIIILVGIGSYLMWDYVIDLFEYNNRHRR